MNKHQNWLEMSGDWLHCMYIRNNYALCMYVCMNMCISISTNIFIPIQWLFLKLHPLWDGDLQQLSTNADEYFKQLGM